MGGVSPDETFYSFLGFQLLLIKNRRGRVYEVEPNKGGWYWENLLKHSIEIGLTKEEEE